MTTIGESTRTLRELLGYSLMDAASEMGITMVELAHIECDEAKISQEALEGFHEAFDVDPYVFYSVFYNITSRIPVALIPATEALNKSWREKYVARGLVPADCEA